MSLFYKIETKWNSGSTKLCQWVEVTYRGKRAAGLEWLPPCVRSHFATFSAYRWVFVTATALGDLIILLIFSVCIFDILIPCFSPLLVLSCFRVSICCLVSSILPYDSQWRSLPSPIFLLWIRSFPAQVELLLRQSVEDVRNEIARRSVTHNSAANISLSQANPAIVSTLFRFSYSH